MLHIHNGDSTAGTLREMGFPGEHFAFREVLAWGPTPKGLVPDEWAALRAAHLARFANKNEAPIREEWARIEDTLAGSAVHEEIVLWFEHDLHCQINMVYLLARFARQSLRPALLSMICIGEFPGIKIFHGLGELTGRQLALLFDTRHQVTEAESNLAQRAWDAYSADDPRELERFLAGGTTALPFLRDALYRHLRRYPSTSNGLGAIENQALRLIAAGHTNFRSLFPAYSNADPIYGGMGDLVLWDSLKQMQQADNPLVLINGTGHDARFTITNTGAEVLAHRRDFLAGHQIDQWLGGVHLTRDNLWRWNEAEQKTEKG